MKESRSQRLQIMGRIEIVPAAARLHSVTNTAAKSQRFLSMRRKEARFTNYCVEYVTQKEKKNTLADGHVARSPISARQKTIMLMEVG